MPIMSMRRWAILIGLILACAIAGSWIYRYQTRCHGIDDCAAQSAEGRERDTPSESR
jgi:hypothetical protein